MALISGIHCTLKKIENIYQLIQYNDDVMAKAGLQNVLETPKVTTNDPLSQRKTGKNCD